MAEHRPEEEEPPVRSRLGAALGRLATPEGLALAVLLAIAALYFWRLDAWLLNDDEGSYLYAAWRISLGELPYRDFLTPQLPAFLLPGGALMKAAGPDVYPARALAVVLTLGAGVFAWATARRLFGAWVALVAGALLLLHPDVYLECRTYRPEPFMLFYAAVALYLLCRGALCASHALSPSRRRWLVASGAFFGLAALSKLFGLLPFAASAAWLIVVSLRLRRGLRELLLDLSCLGAAWGLVVLAGLGTFYAMTTEVYAAVLGHHLRQGAQLGFADVVGKGLGFYATYLRYNSNALLIFVALVVAVLAWRRHEERTELLGWQLPTLLLFLMLSRELWPRHLIYVLPAAATLYALGVRRLVAPRRASTGGGPWGSARGGAAGPGRRPSSAGGSGAAANRWLAGALVAALVVPWGLIDRDTGWRWEDGTWRLGDLIAGLTAPGEVVLSDYSELNFYGLRPTTYSGASLSAGAAGSGQITWERMSSELEAMAKRPQLVVADRTQYAGEEYGHLRFLRDLADFEAWLAEEYELAGVFRRDPQRYRVYAPKDEPLPVEARFDDGPTLLRARPTDATFQTGETLRVVTLWKAEEPLGELVTTLRLLDLGGRQWAQADEALRGSQLRPTSQWEEGELTADRLSLEIPTGTPPGDYELRLGLYRREDLSSLEAEAPTGAPLGQSVAVGRIAIAAPPPVGRTPDGLPIVSRNELETDRLELLGRGPLPEAAIPAGTVVAIDLWWRAQGGARLPLVSMSLVGAEEGSSSEAVVGSSVSPLGVPGSPPEGWPARWLVVRQRVNLPVDASAPSGVYDVVLEVEADQADPLITASARAELGQVEVEARDLSRLLLEPPPHEIELDARVGEVARLVGADVAGRRAPGGELSITLIWQAIAPTAMPYKVSVQLVDDSGAIAAQHDAEPADWSRPTTGWLPGEVVLDRHPLQLGEDLAPGTYELLTRMYDPFTLVALPVFGADAAGDAVLVEEVGVADLSSDGR